MPPFGWYEIAMVDVIISLVDRESLTDLLSMPLGELISGMEGMSIRGIRPRQVDSLHRQFDIDLEGEVLEWADRVMEIDQSLTLPNQDLKLEDKLDLLLLLSHLAATFHSYFSGHLLLLIADQP